MGMPKLVRSIALAQDATSTCNRLAEPPSMNPPTITEVQFRAVDNLEKKSGLIGFIAFTVDGALRLDGVTLRRTTNGRLALSFPARVTSDGRKRSIVWPISDEARLAIESQVFEALQFDAPA